MRNSNQFHMETEIYLFISTLDLGYWNLRIF